MKSAFIGVVIVLLFGAPCMGEEQFKDVPADHWAADSVSKLVDIGVVKGYPDETYRGDQNVTRYELAVVLDRIVYFIQQSNKPVSAAVEQSLDTKTTDTPNPAQKLAENGYIEKDSPLLKDRNKPVTTDELSRAIATVTAKLVEETTPANEE